MAMNKQLWQSALQDALRNSAERVPAGWITREEYAKTYDVSIKSAGYRLEQIVRAKRAQKRKFRVFWSDQIRNITHYRIIARH